MRVVLISGKAGSGKDTAANIMKDILRGKGYRVLITHYADLLKFICMNYFSWDGKKDIAGRTLLQKVGTDIVRRQNPWFWIDFVVSMLRFFSDEWDYVIIPDCRFPNEIMAIPENGFNGVHVRVFRDSVESTLTEEQLQHQSETALDHFGWDVALYNNGTIEELRDTIKYLIDKEYAI